MELGHLLTRSGLTYLEASSEVYHYSFCQLGSSISLPRVIYYETFYLHVVSSFSCIPVICPKCVLFLIPLQFVHLFCNLSKCILLFFSCISSLLLLFFWRHLLYVVMNPYKIYVTCVMAVFCRVHILAIPKMYIFVFRKVTITI